VTEVKVNEGENIESVLKRFKKKVQKAGILAEIKRRERYEKPSVRKKRKSAAARKRKR
jgi:small subunit ribosomal protein S21